MPGSETRKYIVTELKTPESKQLIQAEYSKYARRVLWLDDQVVEGAFHMKAWAIMCCGTKYRFRSDFPLGAPSR